MPLTSLLLNILWIVFGGAWMALAWLVAALIMAITIIGLPWARAAVMMAAYTLLPFGQTVVRRDLHEGRSGIGSGPLGVVGNILWLVFAGWWLAVGHLVTALGLALTIIGLPFAWAHLKLAGLSLWPIGRTVVTHEDADRMAQANLAPRI
ncbi:MAG: YccF domain-containing protein [Alsobacter sp.]